MGVDPRESPAGPTAQRGRHRWAPWALAASPFVCAVLIWALTGNVASAIRVFFLVAVVAIVIHLLARITGRPSR